MPHSSSMDPSSNPVNSDLVAGSAESPPLNYLFLGNPGTGKSTLINCLVGTALFNSGLSYGGGLTKEFQTRLHGNVQYMDTPGLADRNIQQKAAAAITEALQQSGTYKLFFMVRLENGRVVSDDLATIEIVVRSIQLDEIPFTVVVNNVKKRQYNKMMEKGDDYFKVVALINSVECKPQRIVFIPVIDNLDEQDNVVTQLPADVQRFIRTEAATVQIAPSDVTPIKIEDFKNVSERLRAEQEELLNNNALLRRRIAELMERSSTTQCLWRSVGKFLSPVTERFANLVHSSRHSDPSSNASRHVNNKKAKNGSASATPKDSKDQVVTNTL
ncbi:50S ribosome-binding GTPase [Phytophthora infestans]|uniref:50S ribosome-binding GTPase n=1 Tax=Phytophthora infestans TaxID=4787 RepID=A0A833SDG0_PHYIN|nr:50S ribosome-binding GTPase [Phytophthora infestans]